MIDRRLAVAPMLDWTDRHERFFLRLITRRALLYTEMISTGALLYGDRLGFLAFDRVEHPVAFQLGGSEPKALVECARLVENQGYDEVNLNCGCPSERVRLGRFGACLMAEPELVAICVRAMRRAVSIPVTVKTRVGVDEHDSYDDLARFVRTVADAGCETFIVHARKAWLKGLSPKQNREVPPLRYDMVRRLKEDFPRLAIILNGGIKTLEQVRDHLRVMDGAMMGREAYQNPYVLARADAEFYADRHPVPRRRDIVERFIPYVERQLANGVHLGRMTRHVLGLYAGQPGAKNWRRHLSEHAHRPGAGVAVLREALEMVS